MKFIAKDKRGILLKYKPERWRKLKVLMNLNINKLELELKKVINKKGVSRTRLDHFGSDTANPSHEVVMAISNIIGVPVGYFYYEKVSVEFKDEENCFTIRVYETDEISKVEINY